MTPRFQLVGYLRLLADHSVDYIIVGGVGARMQGASTHTQDIDIVPEPSGENLNRLAKALSSPATAKKPSNARSYEPHPQVDASEFKMEVTTSFQTSYGIIDVLMELPGVGGYDNMRKRTRRYRLSEYAIELLVASLDDIIKSKETADRAKDWRALGALYDILGIASPLERFSFEERQCRSRH